MASRHLTLIVRPECPTSSWCRARWWWGCQDGSRNAHSEPSLDFPFFCLTCRTSNQLVMETKNGNKPLWLSILRWGARIIALLFVAFFLVMFIGEGGIWSQPKNLPLEMRDYAIPVPLRFLSYRTLYRLALGRFGRADKPCFYDNLIVNLASEAHTCNILCFSSCPAHMYLFCLGNFHRGRAATTIVLICQ